MASLNTMPQDNTGAGVSMENIFLVFITKFKSYTIS